ncbi:hypothetical protein [Fusobacterium sp.]|uniref:hypothetical protein n=1 Tax=Fusobacterium sp. TaxID=68766 RepID=UPI0026347CE2|nr:hypothetical protein [Fusobacterium sp.]
MNITEALTLAKEKGKKVRPINEEWYVFYKKDDYTLGYFSKGEEFRSDRDFDLAYIKDILSDWEVVEENIEKSDMKKVEELIDEKIEIAKKEIYEKVNRWIDEIW